jgi:hypothetical protein
MGDDINALLLIIHVEQAGLGISGVIGRAPTLRPKGRRVYPNAIVATDSRRRSPCKLTRGMQRPSVWRAEVLSPFDALDACSWRAVEVNGFSSMQAESHAN